MDTLSLPHEHFGSRISLGKLMNKVDEEAVRHGDVEICVQQKSNELFLLWLSTPQAQAFIRQRIKDLKANMEEKKNPSPAKKVQHLSRNPDNKENFNPHYTTNKENIYSPPSPTRVISVLDKKVSPPRVLDFDDGIGKENRSHRSNF